MVHHLSEVLIVNLMLSLVFLVRECLLEDNFEIFISYLDVRVGENFLQVLQSEIIFLFFV